MLSSFVAKAGGRVGPRTCYLESEKELTMNWDQIEGKWEQAKGRVR